MYYNIVKILGASTFAFLTFFSVNNVKAQGTVSLSDNAVDADILDMDNNLPDEISLFDEENEVSTGLIQPSQKNETKSETVEKKEVTTQTTSPNPFQSPAASSVSISPTDTYGDSIIAQTDEKLFSQLSDLEKQTALLTLELRREKIKTEIEAMKYQRQKAVEEEEDAKEKKRREKVEWETEQQKKLLQEQAKIKEAELSAEKLRQERVVKAYKNHMLKENKKWIETLNKAFDEVKAVEDEREELVKDFKNKLSHINALAKKIATDAKTAKENYKRETDNLQTQISILNSRIEAMTVAQAEAINNPFSGAPGFGTSSDPNLKLSDEYMILEIRGKGDNMSARISNKSGAEAFLIQKGTTLKSGHVIEEIAQTYIRADRQGEKDYIYFSAGGILDKEPDSENKLKGLAPLGYETKGSKSKDSATYTPDSSSSGMFAR